MFSSLLDSHCSSFCLKRRVYCLVLLQVPEYFVLVQIFWASPKIWLHLVPHQKPLKRQKNQFYWMQIIFLSGTKCLWLAQYVIKFLDWTSPKYFGTCKSTRHLYTVKLGISELPDSEHLGFCELFWDDHFANVYTRNSGREELFRTFQLFRHHRALGHLSKTVPFYISKCYRNINFWKLQMTA